MEQMFKQNAFLNNIPVKKATCKYSRNFKLTRGFDRQMLYNGYINDITTIMIVLKPLSMIDAC